MGGAKQVTRRDRMGGTPDGERKKDLPPPKKSHGPIWGRTGGDLKPKKYERTQVVVWSRKEKNRRDYKKGWGRYEFSFPGQKASLMKRKQPSSGGGSSSGRKSGDAEDVQETICIDCYGNDDPLVRGEGKQTLQFPERGENP